MALHGIDVSVHNGSIKWFQAITTGKVEFAILRAGFGNTATQKDRRFEENYANATSAGVPLGAYWYSYAQSVQDARKEAEACLSVISGKSFLYPIWYDVEEPDILRYGKKHVSSQIRAFLETVKAAGWNVGLYMSASPLSTHVEQDILDSYPIWVAHINTNKPAAQKYDMWQYSWNGSILGISGDVDMDYCYVDYSTSGHKQLDPNVLSNLPALEDIKPYVVTPDYEDTTIDYARMKDVGVVATFIQVGSLFDTMHNHFSEFKYPKLEMQVQRAVDYDMPYGFVADMSAWSVDEARLECSKLKIYIEKYAPPLGLWLRLNFAKPKGINDVILEQYIKELSKLGLTNKLGIYVTREQLSKITWDNFKDRIYLWLIDHVSNIDQATGFLTPEFFDV